MSDHDSTLRDLPATGITALPPAVLGALHDAVDKVRFGVVQLTVHEGRIVQLDVTERRRF